MVRCDNTILSRWYSNGRLTCTVWRQIGIVDGYGGSFVFSTLDLCCDCLDDPDSLLTSLGTACTYWIGLFSNDCEADVSNIVDRVSTKAGDVCPVTCGSCNAVSLNATQRTCGLCPVGFQYDAESNTYTDFDECSVANGGCDSLMGYTDQNEQWVVNPCTNNQGSFSCNACPDGFEQLGKSCVLPTVLGETVSDTSEPNQPNQRLDDIAAVQPKAVLRIRGPAGALDHGSETEALFLASIQTDLAVSLGARPSDVVVSNVRHSRRRRLQDALIELQFDVLFVNETNSPTLLSEMASQLADSNSPLMNAASTAHLLADQQPKISFVCPVGKVRLDGEVVCRRCPPPSFANTDGASCTECPINQEPTQRGDACRCLSGFINTTVMQPGCFVSDHTQTVDLDAGPVCQSCFGYDCIESCQGSHVVLKPGWAAQSVTSSKSTPIFECREPDACPGGNIRSGNTTKCGQGYTGILCGTCESENYVLTGGKRCELCGSTSAMGVIGIVVLIAILVLALGSIRILYNYLSTMQMMSAAFADGRTIGKIVLATFQILGSIALVLGVDLPDIFRDFIEAISSFLRFDIGDIFAQLSLGCLGSGRYYSSLVMHCLTVAAVVVAVILQFLYREQRDAKKEVTEEENRENAKEIFDRIDLDGNGLELNEVAAVVREIDEAVSDAEIDALFSVADTDDSGVISFEEFYTAISTSSNEVTKGIESEEGSDKAITLDLGNIIRNKLLADRKSDALTKIFLVVFLFYPGLTNKIFDGFMCRELDDGVSVLQADYTIDCTHDPHLRYSVNGTLLLLWPIGLPVILYLWMLRSKSLILSEDPDTLQKFDFVLSDYRTDTWYWEVVELGRKLVLSGLIGLFGRGSIAQSFAAALVSFLFFAISVHMQPFKNPNMNLVKSYTEFQIFGVVLVCIILQTNSIGLPLKGVGTIDFYGSFQLWLTISLLPLVVYVLFKRAHELHELVTKSRANTAGSVSVQNPMDADTAETLLQDWIASAPPSVRDLGEARKHFEALAKICHTQEAE